MGRTMSRVEESSLELTKTMMLMEYLKYTSKIHGSSEKT